MREIRKVAVLGTGVLGSQHIFQLAYRGLAVTAYHIAAWLKENFIDKGRLGIATGEGCYSNTAAN